MAPGRGAIVVPVCAAIEAELVELEDDEKLEFLNEGVLRDNDLQLTQVYDETDYINSAIGLVQANIIVASMLTVVVLLTFLRSPRSTLVVFLAIPTSIIGTFLMLGLLGRSLNVIRLKRSFGVSELRQKRSAALT